MDISEVTGSTSSLGQDSSLGPLFRVEGVFTACQFMEQVEDTLRPSYACLLHNLIPSERVTLGAMTLKGCPPDFRDKIRNAELRYWGCSESDVEPREAFQCRICALIALKSTVVFESRSKEPNEALSYLDWPSPFQNFGRLCGAVCTDD